MCGLPALNRLWLILLYRLHELQLKADQPQAEPGITTIYTKALEFLPASTASPEADKPYTKADKQLLLNVT